MTRSGALTIVGVAALSATLMSAQSREFRPVTGAVLANPSPNDWVAWRGSNRSQGYSALAQIDRANVGRLQLAWAWTMEPGTQQGTPLVYDGVMYLPNPGGVLQALDAATGDLLWEYKTEIAAGARRSTAITRGLAMFDDKVYMTTCSRATTTGTSTHSMQPPESRCGTSGRRRRCRDFR